MNEFEKPLKLVPDTQLVTAFHKEYTLKKREPVRRGMTYWEVDLNTMEAVPVKIDKKVMVGIDGKAVHQNKAVFNPDKDYVWAVNKYNALRKVAKEFESFVKRQQGEQ